MPSEKRYVTLVLPRTYYVALHELIDQLDDLHESAILDGHCDSCPGRTREITEREAAADPELTEGDEVFEHNTWCIYKQAHDLIEGGLPVPHPGVDRMEVPFS